MIKKIPELMVSLRQRRIERQRDRNGRGKKKRVVIGREMLPRSVVADEATQNRRAGKTGFSTRVT